MTNKTLYILWGVLFALCAALGFLPETSWVTTLLSVVFFWPPVMLLRRGGVDTLKLIRNLSVLSLALTALLLVVNFLAAVRSEMLGMLVHCLLVVVSSPMVCSGHWAMSMFLWACLMMVSLSRLKKK